MGRAGHVQTRPPEYGSCISDWAQESFYYYLSNAGISVVSADSDVFNIEDSDHWEILIPEACKAGKWEYDYDAILKIASRLRESPELVKEGWGDAPIAEVGDIAAELLEEGVAAAKKQKCGFIAIDWW